MNGFGTDTPVCWISQEQDIARAQVMIHVPDLSEHTIDIVVEPEEDEAQVEEPVADETLNLRRLLKHPDSGWRRL